MCIDLILPRVKAMAACTSRVFISLQAAKIVPDARGASFQLATTAFEQAFTAQRPECPLESGHALAHDSVAAWKAAPRVCGEAARFAFTVALCVLESTRHAGGSPRIKSL
jgi:hypothetical protein